MDKRMNQSRKASKNHNKRYYGAIVTYVIALLLLIFNYSIRSTVFVGIIIGSIFPFITFLYLYKNYISEKERISSNQLDQISVLSWALPAFFLHIIIIFGFNIIINGPANRGFQGSLYSSFYKYGKLFEQFGEKDIDSFKENSKELNNYVPYYASFFEENNKEKRKTRFQKLIDSLDKKVNDEASRGNEASVNKMDSSNDTEGSQNAASNEDYKQSGFVGLAKISDRIDRVPFFVALSFGFLGALIFCFNDAIARYNNLDLYPKTYIVYIIRFIISGSLAVALSSFVMNEFPIILAPFIFFGIGYFPERAISYIDDKMTKYLGIKTVEYKPIPLSLIQGLSPEKALRLREVGIEDVQHLALADIDFLDKRVPYNKDLLCDWIGQSILQLQFPENIELLRKLGIRTILQLKDFDLESHQVKKQVEHESISEKELDQVKYLQYLIGHRSVDERLCKLKESVKGQT